MFRREMRLQRNVDAVVSVALVASVVFTDMDTAHTVLVGDMDGEVMGLVHMDTASHTSVMVVLVISATVHFGRAYLLHKVKVFTN